MFMNFIKRDLRDYFSFRSIVLQPTTKCNINCSYCYLPSRAENLKMSKEITQKLVSEIDQMNNEFPIDIIWHGGEPLACGLKHFESLISPFYDLTKAKRVSHAIQTNATIINKEWCDLFKHYEVSIGVSLDGPGSMNSSRVDWKGKETFDKTIKGLGTLRENGIDFIVLVVVNDRNIDKADEMYDFFLKIGCSGIGINIEEQEGVNKRNFKDDLRVEFFWKTLWQRWITNPKIRIREFSRILYSIEEELDGKRVDMKNMLYDIFPTIAYNGDVVMLSPELITGNSGRYPSFIVGNIMNDRLTEIINQSFQHKYLSDYIEGVIQCHNTCEYFAHCKGGQASNKFYETGDISSTQTQYCTNSKKIPFNVVLNS